MPDLITVARTHFAAEAESLRLLLESYEIPAVIYGENTGIARAYMAPTVGIRVQVEEKFADRARQIIDSADRRRSSRDGTSWYCGPCREEVETAFETCWSCGQPREVVERPFPSDRIRTTTPASAPEVSTADETVRRAWKTAVLGLGILPVIAHIYSIGLLLEASRQGTDLSKRAKRLFIRTIALDVVAILGFGAVFAMLAGLF